MKATTGESALARLLSAGINRRRGEYPQVLRSGVDTFGLATWLPLAGPGRLHESGAGHRSIFGFLPQPGVVPVSGCSEFGFVRVKRCG